MGRHARAHSKFSWRLTLSLFVFALSIFLALPTGMNGTRSVHAQARGLLAGFLELTTIFFAEGDRIFGRGEIITVSGSVPFIPSGNCSIAALGGLLHKVGDGEDRFQFFPTADLYVIENTDGFLPPLFPLKDVLEDPNRVIGTASLGAFVEEVVAITMPRGNLDKGEYDIVMDQCQDGHYDPLSGDIVLGDGPGFAFKVFIPEAPGEIDLDPLKVAAKNYSLLLGGFEVPPVLSWELPSIKYITYSSSLIF